MTEAKIRVATEADAPILARFRFELRSGASRIESEAEFIERCTAWIQQRLSSDGVWRAWIAEREQTPLGNVWAQVVEKMTAAPVKMPL